MPGPLFTFAAYLGAVASISPTPAGGALIAIVAIFLPGLLLIVGVLPLWQSLSTSAAVQAAMRGANAAVVGLLGAALYDPVWTGAILSPMDFALALSGFVLLTVGKAPPWVVVVALSAGGALLALA